MARLSSPLVMPKACLRHRGRRCAGRARARLSPMSAAEDASPCGEGSAFVANEGGGRNATGLARHLRQPGARRRRAKSDGVPGGGGLVARAADPPPGARPRASATVAAAP